MNNRRLSEIWIYPIKSLAGIRLKQAQVLPKGLQYDRRWMLVDEQGRFLTQREHPEMALFKLTLENNFLTIGHHSNTKSKRLNLVGQKNGVSTPVHIWNDVVETLEPEPDFSAWFSDCMKMKCRLVFFPENNRRDVDPNYAKQQEQVSLADGFPFLIIGQASLDLLNSRLEQKLPMTRFRPNFVFTGHQPHEEDTWQNFTIGNLSFERKKPCGRCVLTTVNPETAEKGHEPLRTLATYRNQNGKINFGQNLIAHGVGTLQEGDLITIIDIKNTNS